MTTTETRGPRPDSRDLLAELAEHERREMERECLAIGDQYDPDLIRWGSDGGR